MKQQTIKTILETLVKTLGNCDRIKLSHVSDKDQQNKDLKIQLQEEKENISKIQCRNKIKNKHTRNLY